MTTRAQVRLYRFWSTILMPLNVLLGMAAIGAAALPGVYAAAWVFRATGAARLLVQIAAACAVLPAGFFVFGVLLAFVAGAFGRIYRLPRAGGRYGVFSWKTIQWGLYGFWTGVAHLTFIPRIMPFAPVFWRMMGAKVGKRIFMPNPAGVADFALLSFGDECIIASDVVIIAHTARRGEIQFDPVKIGNRVTLGSQAIISGGVEIGDDAVVAPSSFVLPRTKIGPGEIWMGVPAKQVLVPGGRAVASPPAPKEAAS